MKLDDFGNEWIVDIERTVWRGDGSSKTDSVMIILEALEAGIGFR